MKCESEVLYKVISIIKDIVSTSEKLNQVFRKYGVDNVASLILDLLTRTPYLRLYVSTEKHNLESSILSLIPSRMYYLIQRVRPDVWKVVRVEVSSEDNEVILNLINDIVLKVREIYELLKK